MRWKTSNDFDAKFIQETMHQISAESPEFYGRYHNKHCGLFYSRHNVDDGDGAIG